jgi:uncharacterized membrane-anchored protein YhcB (DUF1043 family)
MEFVVPFLLFVVGGVIGFFIAKYLFADKQVENTKRQVETDLKALLAQQAEHHLHTTAQAIRVIEQQCQTLQHQLDDYKALLQQPAEDRPSVPFFDEQTTRYLRNNLSANDKRSSVTVADSQPRDFAAKSSGLFSGTGKSNDH